MDRELTYGDFPGLFWDAPRDAPLDPESSVTLVRLLTRGTPETIGRLVPLHVIRRRLDALPLPRHVFVFWRTVLDGTPPVGPGPMVRGS